VRLDVKFSRTLSKFGRKMRPFGRSLEPCRTFVHKTNALIIHKKLINVSR